MKNIILLSVLAMSASASATTIYSWNSDTKSLTKGFTEDGFGGPDSICYVGPVNGVCTAIRSAEKRINKEYSEGGHGNFVIRSCKVNEPLVKVKYTRVNDWDKDKAVTLVAKECVMRM